MDHALVASRLHKRFDTPGGDALADITLAAAARNFFSRALLALNVDLDIPAGLSPDLQAALLEPLPFRAAER